MGAGESIVELPLQARNGPLSAAPEACGPRVTRYRIGRAGGRPRRAPPMSESPELPRAADKPLFTPGPLTTSRAVKQAMLRDLGSRDRAFVETVARVRTALLELAGVSVEAGYECVLVQGSGTFGIEAVVSSAVPRDGKLLAVVNGAYGERIATMATVLGIGVSVLRFPEHEPPDPAAVDRLLGQDPRITHVALVHCETTTGMLNPVDAVGAAVARHGKCLILDSMSAFGAVPVDLEGWGVDALVSSANKCIEGVPGFAFALCRRASLESWEGRARSLSLDLHAQWKGLEANGQFRFTPPTHAILAFEQALAELALEGGVSGRAARYRRNRDVLLEGMRDLGFEEYLRPELQSHVIASFRYPDHPGFTFEAFYDRLNEKGFVIYPGKVSDAGCFRIGTIGRLFESDVRALLGAVAATLSEMGVA